MSQNNYTFPWGVYIGDLIDNNDTIPLCLDSKQGGFCVLFDEESEAVANNFIENVALKLFEVMPLGSIEIDVFDFGRPRFMKLSALKKANLYTALFSKNKASDRFDILDELENDRLHNLLQFDTPTLSEYNEVNNEKEKFHLLLINLDDFPDEMSSPKRIKNFFDASYDAGFYIIAFGSQEVLQSKSKATQAILKRFNSIEIESNRFKISNELFGFDELLLIHEFEYINRNKEKIVTKVLSNDMNSNHEDYIIFYGLQYFTEYLSYHEFISRCEKSHLSEFKDFIDWAKKSNIPEEVIPRNIKKLKNLTSLEIGQYKLENSRIPESIGSLTNLTELKIWGNNLYGFPHSIRYLTNLTKLTIGLISIYVLPDWIRELKKLTSLSVYYTHLEKLPDWIGDLTNLVEINFDNNELIELPNSIGNLSNLTSLRVRSNKLKKLPKSIGNLNNLLELDIGSNELTNIPNWIENLSNLTILVLGYNKLPILHNSIVNLSNLTVIDVYKIGLKTLPDSIENLHPDVQRKLKKELPLLKRLLGKS